MKILNRLVKNNLASNKKRSLATLVSIFMTCLLVFTISIAFSTIEHKNIEEAIETYGSYHVRLRNLDYQSTLSYLSNDKDIAEIVVLQELQEVLHEDELNFNVMRVSIKAFDKDVSDYLELQSGRTPSNERELLIHKTLADRLNIRVNDAYENYTVVGIYEKNTLSDGYDSSTMPTTKLVDAYTKKAVDVNNTSATFYITYKNSKEAYHKIKENCEHLNLEHYFDSSNESKHVKKNSMLLSAYNIYEDETSNFNTTFYLEIILYILSLFCILIIKNSFSMTLEERQKQFGILRSIGASKRQIITLVLKEVLVLSALSIPLALLGSVGMIKLGLWVVNRLLDSAISLHIYYNHLAIAILFTIFIVLTSAIAPALKASKATSIQSIKKSPKKKRKKTKENYKLIKMLFGTEGEVAYKNIKRNGKKFLSTTSTLTISIVLFLIGSTFINYAMENTDEELQNYDAQIHLSYENALEENLQLVEDIENLKYADDILISKGTSLPIQSEDFTEEYKKIKEEDQLMRVVGLDKKSYDRYKTDARVYDDKPLVYNKYTFIDVGGSIYTGKTFKNTPKIEICENTETGECYYLFDTVHLTDQNYKNRFYDTSIVMDIEHYDDPIDTYVSQHPSNFNMEGVTYGEYLKNVFSIYIDSKDFKKLDEEIQSLMKKYPDRNINYSNPALDAHEIFVRFLVIKLMLYATIGFIALISISEMLNSINTNLYARAKELSMLRSIGLSKKGLNKMIRLENIFLVTRSIIHGIVLSLLIIVSLRYVSSMQTMPNVEPRIIPYPWKYIVISVILVIAIVLIATKFTASKIKKQNIIDSIRNDSI